MRIESLGNNEDNALAPAGGEADSLNGGDLKDVLTSGDTDFYVADERKPAGRSWMVLALLVALGGGGLYVMHLRSGPAKAAAAAETQKASKTIASFLEGGETNIKVMEKMLNDTQKVVERFVKYPNANQVPLSELQTNPFKLAAEAELPVASEVALRKRREEERQAVLSAVQTLRLQSVMSGAGTRSCMINNALYREGQVVEGFTVERVTSDSVIVRQGPYRFELRMQR